MTAPTFAKTLDSLRTPFITLGRLRVAQVSPEFQRIDHDGSLTTRIVKALAADPGLAEAIQAATFEDPEAHHRGNSDHV